MVARLDPSRGLQGQAGAAPFRPLRRVVAGRSAAAQTLRAAVRQARRCARCRTAGAVPRGDESADRRRPRALPRRLRHEPPGLAARQLGGHLRVQPARASGLPRDLSRRGLRRRPGGHHRRIEDVLLLLRQEVPPRPGRRQADRLDVRARRMEPSLPLRRRDRIGEIPDHARRVGGPQRRPGRHEGAADLFRRERHVSREGSVFRPLLPHQPRWHRTAGPDQVRRQSHHRPVRRCQAVRRYLFDRGRRPGDRAAPVIGWRADHRTGASRYDGAGESRMEGAGSVRGQRARWCDRHLGCHLPTKQPSTRRGSIR